MASAVRYLYVDRDNGEKGTLLFIRDLYSRAHSIVASEKIVVFLDKVFVREDKIASRILHDDLIFTRDVLEESYLDTIPLDPSSSVGIMPVAQVSVFEIMKKIHQVVVTTDTVRYNFEPLSQEALDVMRSMHIYENSFPLTGKMNEKSPYFINPEDTFIAMKEMKEAMSLIIRTEDKKKDRVDKKEIFDTSDTLGTFVTMFQGPVTEKVLKRYLKSRHEIVVRTVQEALDIPFEESDINIPKKYDFRGLDSHLTPDLAYHNEMDNKIHLIDIAVTRSRVDTRAESKEAYYSLLAEELSVHLGVDVVADSVVVSIMTGEEIYMPSYLSGSRTLIEETQEALISIERVMKTKDNYLEATVAMERKLAIEQLMEKNDAMKKMSSTMLKISNINNMKAADLKESFTAGADDIFPKMVENSEDEMLARIKEEYKDFRENDYMASLLADMSSQYAKGKQPVAIRKLYKKKDIKKVVDEITAEGKETRERFDHTTGAKIPKIFKFPNTSNLRGSDIKHAVEGMGQFHSSKDDGTMRFTGWVQTDEQEGTNVRKGMGISPDEDKMVVEELIDTMSQDSSEVFRNMIREVFRNAPKRMQSMFEMKIFEVAFSIKELAENIIYMEGRRFEKSSKFTVVKHFQDLGYTLSVMAGSRLTEEGQVRYKITSLGAVDGGQAFHSIKDIGDEVGETGWLTVSVSDLKTMSVMFEKCVALASHYLDCMDESRESDSYPVKNTLKSKVIMMPLLIMMEMKRGTSTTSQYNRFILNSMMGYISDQEKAVRDIMSDPIRTRLESFVRISQMDWAMRLATRSKDIWFENLMKKISTERDYDTLFCPAIYSDLEDLEFCVQMNDIYHGNLFQKEAGFTSHRSKAVISKTMEAEREFLDKRDPVTMNSNMTVEDCFVDKDEKHKYSKDFVMLMGKKVAQKIKNNPLYEEKVLSKLTDNMHDTMMMTYSLQSARVPTATLEQEMEQKTELSFITMYQLIEEFGTSMTLGMISRDSLVEAVFSMFPKAQIGGPREILIQSFRMRIHVKFLENFFEGLCSMHPKEMLTKGLSKERIQSSTASEFKKSCIRAVTKEKRFPISATLVADASRWAPSFVMHMFLHFLVALELPTEIEEHFSSVLRAFSSKVSMMPKSLKKKWDKKVWDQLEEEEIMQWAREMGNETEHTLRIISGMGQGMLHRFSSFLHCAKDDILDDLYRAMESRRDIKIEMVTMISSDDLMKQMFLSTKDPKVAFESLHKFMVAYEVTNMLSNIHTNWKKTSLSFLIDEFNSYFSTGKRAIMAVIKDVFTAMEVVDLTEPITAVKTVVSNISRAFKNGMYLDTAEIMFVLMRVFLTRSYAITDKMTEELCDLLNCKESMLPADLGYLSTDHILGQMIFGSDILMFREDNSEMLMSFYKKTFTGVREEAEELLRNDYISAISGRIRLSLPYRVDKKLTALKERTMNLMTTNMDSIMKMNEESSLFADEGKNTSSNMVSYTRNYFIGTNRKYEFSAPMVIHSMIRALQMQGDNLSAYPEVRKGASYSLLGFTSMILERDSTHSAISMYSPYAAMMETMSKAELSCRSITRSEGRRHNKKVSLRFRTRELVMSADTKEIISFVTGEPTKVSNRITRIMEDLCKILSMDFRKFMNNPVLEIMEVLHDMKYPRSVFRKVVENYVSTRINFSIDCMCSFLDKGNALDNITSLFCERKSAAHLYTSKAKGSFTNVANDINTWMALGGSIDNIPWDSIVAMMDESMLTEADHILTADGPLERMAKILFKHKKNNEIPVSDFIFHRSNMISRHKVMHVYCDFSDLVVVVTDTKNGTHYINLIGDVLHTRTDSSVYRLAKFEMSSTMFYDFTKLYWNGNVYQLAPITHMENFAFKTAESTMKNKWQFKLVLKWNSADEENNNTIHMNICSDSYTISSESLMRLADEDLVSDFSHMQMMEPNIYSMQALMIKNNITSSSVFGRMTARFEEIELGSKMSDDLMAFSTRMDTSTYLGLFDNVDLRTMFDTMLHATENTEEEEAEDYMDITLLDEEMVSKLRSMMDEEAQLAIYETPAWERKSINEAICELVMKFQEQEMTISFKKIIKIFANVEEQEEADKIWSILASEIMLTFTNLEEFMGRVVLISVYKSVSRRKKVLSPKNVCLIEGYRIPMAPLISSTSVEDYNIMMGAL